MFPGKSLNLTILVPLIVIALVLTGCDSVVKSEVKPAAGEITVIGKGEAVGKPDQAQVQVGVDILADSVEAAASQNQAVINEIMSALTAQGVEPKDIQTTNFNVWVEQIYLEGQTPQVGGYHVSNQVNVTIREIDKVGEVLSAVIGAGANNIFGISFSVADPATLEAEARAKAMEDARARAEDLAQLGHVELGEVKLISEVIAQTGPPFVAFEQPAAMEAPSIAPGQLTFQIQLQVTYNIK